MSVKAKALIAGGITAAVLVTAGVAGVAVGGFPAANGVPPTPSSTPGTSTAAPQARTATEIGRDFLSDWVDHSGSSAGRVVRRDQGGDTVSEGQAYGMLIADGVGDQKSFSAIWSWTTTHLKRKDGLMAWRWDDGKVVDEQPASDADLDMAWALVLAGKTFDDPAYTNAGTALGTRILDDLTVETPDGRILLPGLWAQGSGPWSYNPSYASPAAYAEMAEATKDPRWEQLAAGSRKATTKILEATALPSEWAQVKTDGSVVPLATANGGAAANGSAGVVEYGYNAARLPVRYAESCSAQDVALAAKLAGPLSGKSPLPMELDLGGTALNQDQSPLGYVARAAAEASSGQRSAAQADLQTADTLSQSTPTYYGAAWDALGALQLETRAFNGCSPLKGH
jgi:endoglucanase